MPEAREAIGQAVHAWLAAEYGDEDGLLTEYDVSVGSITGADGEKHELRGRVDLYDMVTGAVVDWKTKSPSAMRVLKSFGPRQKDVVQLSLYGLGLRRAGYDVRSCVLVAIPVTARAMSDIYALEWPFDPRPGVWALKRATRICSLLHGVHDHGGIEAVRTMIDGIDEGDYGGRPVYGDMAPVDDEIQAAIDAVERMRTYHRPTKAA